MKKYIEKKKNSINKFKVSPDPVKTHCFSFWTVMGFACSLNTGIKHNEVQDVH